MYTKLLGIVAAVAVATTLATTLASSQVDALEMSTPPITLDTKIIKLLPRNEETNSFVSGGAYGKFEYKKVLNSVHGDLQFRFLARGLEEGKSFTLVRYSSNRSEPQMVCLGEASSNQFGSIPVLRGELLPGGKRVLLVPSENVDCEANKSVDFSPELYLFGTRPIVNL